MTKAIQTQPTLEIARLTESEIRRKEEMKELTGCTHTIVIEGHCEEPGCHNSFLSPAAEIPGPVIEARPRKWCVL